MDKYKFRKLFFSLTEFEKNSYHPLVCIKGKPKLGKNQLFKIKKTNISLEIHKNFKNLINKKNSTIFAIIDGNVVDKHKRRVLSYGDIIRTGTLKKLSEVFKIRKYLTVIRVWK